MHPILLRLGDVDLPSYGASMAVGFIAAILLGVRGARRQGISTERILDLSFWILVAALLGSRLLFIVTNLGNYARLCVAGEEETARSMGQWLYDCSRALHLWEGGYVFYGGLIAAVLVSVWFARRHGINFFKLADLVIPLVALGHFFGRLGCFFAGCCYGKPTESMFGVVFPKGSLAHHEMLAQGALALGSVATPPLHPTQLYESLAELCIFGLLLLISRRRTYYGQVLVTYLVLYPATRFFIEIFRGDPDRGYLFSLHTPGLNRLLELPAQSTSLLSTSQALGLAFIVFALVLHRLRGAPKARR
jgi:phosphatidylglycerol:prolipoprotein diacylglycerol transferase